MTTTPTPGPSEIERLQAERRLLARQLNELRLLREVEREHPRSVNWRGVELSFQDEVRRAEQNKLLTMKSNNVESSQLRNDMKQKTDNQINSRQPGASLSGRPKHTSSGCGVRVGAFQGDK